MPPGRPIVSDVSSETYRISEYIDSFINPLSIKHNSYIKNFYEFVNKIKDFAAIHNNYLLVTGDITSLYTNMDSNRSINCVREAFLANKNPSRPDKHILELLKICLKNNDFEFNNQFYLQTHGISMGKRFAPALANLYLLEFDNSATNDFCIKPVLYFRFLDDIFFLWPGDIASLKQYEIFLNNLLPNIKVTLEYSNKEINFLDTCVYIHNNKLNTRVYFKKTDTHQLLHKQSFHPEHIFKSIIKSQLIRFKRLSSTKQDFDKTCNTLFSVLKTRGYPMTKLRAEKAYIWFNYTDTNKNQLNAGTTTDILPIILPYNSINTQLAKNYKTLINNSNCFPNTKLITAFKSNKNLKQLLVKSKLSNIKRTGSFITCGKNSCRLCQTNAFDTQHFNSSNNNKTFTIRDKLSCDSTDIIYLITCTKCNKQYVGETGRSLRERASNHKSAIRNKTKTPIGIHFNTYGHSIVHFKITAIEKMINQNKSNEMRRKREAFWQTKLDTLHPNGLNGLNAKNFNN